MLRLSTEAAKGLINITVLGGTLEVIVEGRKIITYSLCLIRLSQVIDKNSENETISQSDFSPRAAALNYHISPVCPNALWALPAVHAADRHSQVSAQMCVLVCQKPTMSGPLPTT